MLKQRVFAALILIPLVVGSVLYLPTPLFAALLALVVLAAGWEWSRLIPVTSINARTAFLLLLVACLAGAWLLHDVPVFRHTVLVAALLWWLCALVWLSRPTWGRDRRGLKIGVSLVTLVPVWLALVVIHSESRSLVLFLMVLIWIADSAAYFSGRRFGRHKLAPAVSPGKTWEGVAGGLSGSVLFALAAGALLGIGGHDLITFSILALLVAGISVVGDLLISLLKRQQGVKDSGHLIPGHGGILDRVDSLTAAAPVFVYGYDWLKLG